MIANIIFYYTIYLLLYNLYKFYNEIALLNRFKITIETFIMNLAAINAYNNYIEYNYNEYLLKKNRCVMITLNNNKSYNVIISNLHKISGDFAILIKNSCFAPFFSDIKNIVDNPNLYIKTKLLIIFKNIFPIDIIQYIGDYICNCKSCKNIIDSS